VPEESDDSATPEDLDDLEEGDLEADDDLELEDLDDDLGEDEDDDDLGDDDDLVDDVVAVVEGAEGEPAAGAAAERPAEEGEEDEDEEAEDEDVEASLDVILKERLVVEDEVEDDEPTDAEDRTEATERVLPKQPDEFVCKSCFLVKHASQLADKRRGLCRDCV
jgi:hypothetical protein